MSTTEAAPQIQLGDWVVVPDVGLAQVWATYNEGDGVEDGYGQGRVDMVMVATGTEYFHCRRAVLELADLGEAL